MAAKTYTAPLVSTADPEQFKGVTAEEAVLMSRNKIALGYDDLFYGEQWLREGKHPGHPIIRATVNGLEFLLLSDQERALINSPTLRSMESTLRKKTILATKFTLWEDLLPVHRDFASTLYWLPVEPMTEMEIIAVMSSS